MLDKKIEASPAGKSKTIKHYTLALGKGLLVLACIIMAFIFYITRNAGIKTYDNFEEFQVASYNKFYLPEGAEDLKMVTHNRTVANSFLLSYTLDDDELEALINKNIEEHYTKTNEDGSTEVEFDEFYNHAVKDFFPDDNEHTYGKFPNYIAFDLVIDDSLDDYVIIYFYPQYSGNHSYGTIYNKETNRVVEFYYATF